MITMLLNDLDSDTTKESWNWNNSAPVLSGVQASGQRNKFILRAIKSFLPKYFMMNWRKATFWSELK